MTATLLPSAGALRATFPFSRSGAHEVRVPAVPLRRPARAIRIGLLGCGTIGSALAVALDQERERFAAQTGVKFALARVLVRRPEVARPVPSRLVTTCFDDVLAARPDVIVEALGGVEPAASYIQRSLEAGIPVVTANKTVLALHGPSLQRVARRHSAPLLYEATVCAALPILSVLEQLRGDRIHSIHGIVNGSTNYVLTRMSTQSLSLPEALVEAKSLGLIEPDPAADLSGRDAAEKLAILGRAAGFRDIDFGSIDVAGIERITGEDILAARRAGFVIKLIASLHREAGDSVSLRVGPTLVARSHRLANVDRERNAVVIDAELGGEIAIEGAGAGPKPTSSAIIGDLVRIARLIRGGGIAAGDFDDSKDDPPSESFSQRSHRHPPARENGAAAARFRHYIRLRPSRFVKSPRVLIEAFRANEIEIRSLDLRDGVARIWTFDAPLDSTRLVAKEVSEADDFLIAPILEPTTRPLP